jgi:hypothetical protein
MAMNSRSLSSFSRTMLATTARVGTMNCHATAAVAAVAGAGAAATSEVSKQMKAFAKQSKRGGG